MKSLGAGLIVVLAFSLSSCTVEADGLNWWTASALVKARPSDPAPAQPSHSVQIFAARNEFEPFQIIFRSGTPVEGMDVEIGSLAGPHGAVLDSKHITVYLERYIDLHYASSLEGDSGEWPDALIPRVDRYVGEKRNAFPFALKPGRNQPVWVDVYVPVGTPPGKYTGTARVTARGSAVANVPIELTVWNFTLPSTSTLKTSFGFNGLAALKRHAGRYTNEHDLLSVTQLYEKAALLHRISVHGGTMAPPRLPDDRGTEVNWAHYDEEVAPFLNGAVLTNSDPLPGARATSAEVRLPSELSDSAKAVYFRAWVEHFRQKGWFDRLFYYLWDEPTPDDYSKLVQLGRVARRAAPDLRNLVTATLNPELRPVIDIWAPLINCMDRRPGFRDYCKETEPRSAYDSEIQQGKSLWWYQSCASHGCNIRGNSSSGYFQGWPSYMIDVAPVANRVFQWLAWKYRIEGELYFDMDEAFFHSADPWGSVELFGGNGDGTLFYPGTPDRIGGASGIPIESIRLKLIREGLEDYEYLAMSARLGMTELAERSVEAVAPGLYNWDRRPEVLYEARRALGEKLSERGSAGEAVSTK